MRKLSKHIKHKHKIEIKDYYDNYVKTEKEGFCAICEKETKYRGISMGYGETCCDSCRAILFRRRLKQDTEKFEKFSNKVKNNMISEWKIREQNGKLENRMEQKILLFKRQQKKLEKMLKI
jgi:hypothetical protein